jgi:hypothetical protein
MNDSLQSPNMAAVEQPSGAVAANIPEVNDGCVSYRQIRELGEV